MLDYSPAEAARLLGIKPGTLRRWSQEFPSLLSPGAAASGPTVRRRYTDSDIAVLQQAQRLLAEGKRYGEVRATLLPNRNEAATIEASSSVDEPPAPPIVGEVTVIQPSDQAAALAQLVEAQRQMLLAQQQHIEAQQTLISQLQAQSDYDRAALDRARADEARALEALRSTLAKVPRWLRGLLGLGA